VEVRTAVGGAAAAGGAGSPARASLREGFKVPTTPTATQEAVERMNGTATATATGPMQPPAGFPSAPSKVNLTFAAPFP